MNAHNQNVIDLMNEVDRLTRENDTMRKALLDIRSRARFELDNPTELRDTALSLIEKAAIKAQADVISFKEPTV